MAQRRTKREEIRHRQIAPRLASGESRVPFGHGLPEPIKEGLRAIAARENKSMSWVMETLIIDSFGFKKPEYKMLGLQQRLNEEEAERAHKEKLKRKRNGHA